MAGKREQQVRRMLLGGLLDWSIEALACGEGMQCELDCQVETMCRHHAIVSW
jgi:hypothetical protein